MGGRVVIAVGHVAGLVFPGIRQRSLRSGAECARMTKLAYLPMRPALVTRTCRTVPAGRKRSKARSRAGALATVTVRTGQPRPTQRAAMCAERGALTESSVTRTPLCLK